LTITASRRTEQLRVRPNAMQDHRARADSIDEQQVGSQVAFPEATPAIAALSETMLAQSRWERLAGDQGVEDILERFGVELSVLASVSVIALEAREDDQFSSQRMASRPLSKRRPLPVVSSFNESLRAPLSCAAERLAFARAAQALSAAVALRLPVRALSASISPSLS